MSILRAKNERKPRRARNEVQQLAAIVTSSSDAIISLGLDQIVRTWNPGATLLFGYAEAEAVGRTIDELIVPDDLRAERARIYETIRSGQQATAKDTVRRRKDGSLVSVEISASPMRDSEGRVSAICVLLRDISQRKAADAALRHSEQLHRIAFDLAPTGMAYLGADGIFTKVNGVMCEITGYSADELARMKVTDLTHPDDLSRDIELLDAFLSGGTPAYENEKRYVRKDGSIRWVAVTARMVTDDAGQPLHGICVNRDIHDRKTAQTALRTSEIRYRRLFEAAHDGVLLVDPDTRKIIDANPFMTKLLGYTRDQLIGKELYEIGLLSDARASQDMFAELKRTQQIRYENLPLESQGGQRREVEVVANLYDEDGQFVIQCNVRDITERKRAEESLARLAAIVESSDDAIVGKDLKGTITSWNSGAEAMFGFSAEEIIGQPILRIIPSERQGEETEILARIARGDSIRHFETVRQRKDGSTVEISVAVSPIKDASGTIVGASKVVRDITKRKRAEIARQRSHDSYLSLIENNPFGVYLVDSEFRISKVSVGAQPVFGNVKPLLGRDFEEVIRQLWQEPFASEVIARFRHTFETGEPYRTKDTTEPRGDIDAVESYDWQIERVTLPDGRFGVVCYFYDLSERKRYEEHISLLMHEVDHRAKNLLAVVHVVTRQTARSGDPETFEARLSDRIAGLTASHDLLVNNQWKGVEVSDLARGQLAHFKDLIDTRVLLDGPPARLSAAAAQAIGMALHELATNAGKYGALGDNEGRVRISWKIAGAPKPTFTMQWLEENGPEVVPPSRSGFGQTVMVRMVEHAVDGTVKLDYQRTGVSWRLTAPLAGVQEASKDG